MAGRKITVEFLGDSKDLQNAIGDVDGKSGKLGATLKKVGKAAAVGLGLGVLAGGAALYKMTQGAIEDEAAQAKLATTLKNTAGATDKQISSVENWISAQGKALGVTDDELRPALSKLATATGDVGEAQKLASLAMDVSAGSGKSLDSVATALMKAQNGQIAGLSKLGIETKNAAGETMTFEEVTKNMAKTFKGQAATQADTLEGKMDRLKLIMSEAGETIGSKVIPMVTTMADWFMSKGLPAVEDFGNMVAEKLGPPLEKIGTWIRDTLAPAVKGFVGEMETGTGAGGKFASAFGLAWDVLEKVGSFIVNNKTAVATFAGVIATVAAATKTWAVVQGVLNAVMTANPLGLVVVAIAAVAAGLVMAYKKSETFRDIVDGAFAVVRKAFEKIGDAVEWVWKNAVQPVFDFFIDKIKSVIGFVADMLSALGKAPGMGWATDAANKLRAAAEQGERLGKSVRDIPTQKSITVSFLYKGGGKLKAPGQFGDDPNDPLMQAAQRTSQYAATVKKGFAEGKMKELLEPAGRALLEGLVAGIDKKKAKLDTVLEKITSDVQAKRDKLTTLLDNRRSIIDSFKGFAQSVFGADTATEGSPASVQKLIDFGAWQRGKAETLNADVQSLIGKGLSKDLINELIASGESGMDQIHLLASATTDQIAALNANQAATQAALTAAGLKAADAVMGEQVAQAERDVKLADGIRDKLAELLEKQDKNTIVQLVLDGKVLHASLLKLKKAKNSKLDLD